MFAVSVGSFAPLLGCGLMMVVCMGPMLSQRVWGWFRRGDRTEVAQGLAPDAGTAAELAALRREVGELRSLRAEGPNDRAVR